MGSRKADGTVLITRDEVLSMSAHEGVLLKVTQL
jgi:hypothetical protein